MLFSGVVVEQTKKEFRRHMSGEPRFFTNHFRLVDEEGFVDSMIR